MILRRTLLILPPLALFIAVLACSQGSNPVLYVTATAPAVPSGEPTLPNPFRPTPTPSGPTPTAIHPTPNPTYPPKAVNTNYTIQNGDTLATIAQAFGTTIDEIVKINDGLSETST